MFHTNLKTYINKYISSKIKIQIVNNSNVPHNDKFKGTGQRNANLFQVVIAALQSRLTIHTNDFPHTLLMTKKQ